MTASKFLAALVCAGLPSAALANIEARFIEGAPKDRFEITSFSDCLGGDLSVTIALDGSAGGLIFDTTDQGAGVEVFQPFQLVAGRDLVTQAPEVKDGDTELQLRLSGLPKGQSIAFTLDVDDTGGAREITVSGAEIEGAMLRVRSDTGTQEARFGTDARARTALRDCAS